MHAHTLDLQSFLSSSHGKKSLKSIREVGLSSGFLMPEWALLAEPLQLKRDDLLTTSAALDSLFKELPSLARRVFENNTALYQFCGLDSSQINIFSELESIPSAWAVPLRWDVILTHSGPKAVEVNHGWALGGINMSYLQRSYDAANIPSLEKSWTYPLENFAQLVLNAMSEEKKTECFICDDDYFFSTYRGFISYLQNILEKKQIAVDAFPISDWKGVCYSDKKNIEVFSALEFQNYPPEFLKNYVKHLLLQKAKPFTSPYDVLLTSKSMFALLWKGVELGYLDLTVKKMVEDYIPYSLVLNCSLKEEAHAQQNRWVLKPAYGMSGVGVVVGSFVDRLFWETCLEKALQSPGVYILQEYAAPLEQPFHTLYPDGSLKYAVQPFILGLFQVNGEFAGGMVRAGRSQHGNINSSTGAGLGIIREIL